MKNRGGNPLSQAFYGANVYLRGVRWLLGNKKYLFITFLPTLLGLIFLFSGWGLFIGHYEEVLAHIVFDKPDSWYMLALYWVVYCLAFLAVMGGGLVFCLLMVNFLASPLYDLVSAAVERDLTGEVKEISLWEGLKLMGEELKKVSFILVLSLLGFAVTFFIPIAGFLSLALTAFLLGWDFYDYPLARRGLSFSHRFEAVKGDLWSVMAFGLWMLIPFVQFFLMPLAVAGGTILCIEGLGDSSRLDTKESV